MKSGAKRVNLLLIVIMVATILFIFVALFAGWYFIMGMATDLAKTKTESVYINKQEQALTSLGIKYTKALVFKDTIFDSLPNDKNISSFIADVEGVAQNNNISVKETIIGSQKNSTKAADPSLSQLTKVSNYYELPIEVTFSGSYQGFANAVNELSNLRRVTSIINVSVLKIIGNGAEKTDQVNATVNLIIFVKK